MELKSCITDKPIENNSEDKLKMSRYGTVLSNFIKQSDTPLTVGLQGEWGTGKTSMLYMLLEHFKRENVATSWVNTWEYSMFRNPAETTPAILKGMLTNLKLSCENEGRWTIEEKSKDSVKKVFKFLGNVANQVISNQTGVDIKDAVAYEASVKEQAEIAALEVSKAALDEFKEARAVQSALVAALMTAVGEVQGVRGNTSPRSPGSAKSGILRRYF